MLTNVSSQYIVYTLYSDTYYNNVKDQTNHLEQV